MMRARSSAGGLIAAIGVSLLLAVSFVGSACNLITGADGMLLSRADDDDDDDDDSTTTQTSSGGTGTGAGGLGAGGSGATTTTTTTNTGGTGTGGNGQGAQGAGPTQCDYPSGPYGVGQGQTMPPNLSWQGYAPSSNTVSTVTSEDFFDCDGTKGIDAVLFDTSQFG